MKMNEKRLQKRQLRLWKKDYLVYRYLWPNIEWAIHTALETLEREKPYVIDIGCGHKPYSDLFESCDYLGVDYTDNDSSPDIIADATNIPLESETADIVFSTQVIEHVPNPQDMVKECFRLLKPGGYLILTGPFYWPIHEEPYDFYRFTKYGFEHLLKSADFDSWDIKPDGGDWAQLFLSVNLNVSKWFFPLRIILNILGVIFDKFNSSHKIPSNYTILAKK
jgi:SAM-dependent methyltransferase